MKTIGFIGAYDKIDLIMNVAKALTELDNRVLVIDTTTLEKAKYLVPTISPTKAYMTDFEKVDFAIGFENLEEIYMYIGLEQGEKENQMPYDYILIDVDKGEKFFKFKLQNADANYFVTGFDLYSLRRGMEIIDEIKNPVKFIKVLYSYEITKSDEEYLDFLSLEKNVIWSDYSIYFTILREDAVSLEENQRVSQIRLKRLTNEYKDSLSILVQDIAKEVNINRIKKVIKG